MANYYGFAKTNYFRVTDEDRYAKLFSHLVVSDGDMLDDFSKEENGVVFHGFGAYSSIDFKVSSPESQYLEYDFDAFIEMLQEILPDGEAFIYTEVGHEKLCYLTGYSIVATKDEVRSISLNDESLNAAREMLKNPEFEY
ncbi:MAG: hypothetical protein IJ341_02685 [Bacteroidales bacterium]|nr:hypothetical protein [Bacteroidales bacterium]